MKKAVIGIASLSDGEIEPKLPIARVYTTNDGEFVFLSKKVLERAIAFLFEKLRSRRSNLDLSGSGNRTDVE